MQIPPAMNWMHMFKEKSVRYPKIIAASLISILLLTIVLTIHLLSVTATPDIHSVGPWPFEFRTIQEAINNVNEGDIIEVSPLGSPYVEHLVVNKSVTIRRHSYDPDECIVNGNGTGTVMNVTANNVNICKFTIQNASYAVRLVDSSNNVFESNKIKGTVLMEHSSNNNFTSNTFLTGSEPFQFSLGDRTFEDDYVLEDFVQNISESNTVNGKTIYYWVNGHGGEISGNAGYVALINCTNINVRDIDYVSGRVMLAYTNQSIMENLGSVDCRGILLLHSHNNTIRRTTLQYGGRCLEMHNSTWNVVANCLASYGGAGIFMVYSHDNVFMRNNITSCLGGITLYWSAGNVVFHNNFMYYSNPLELWGLAAYCDNGREGNHWTSYAGPDNDHDDIGDVQYLGVDEHPLKEPWSLTKWTDITWQFEPEGMRYFVSTECNNTVAYVKYHVKDGFIAFNLTAGSAGYCNVSIPRDKLDDPFRLEMNGTTTPFILTRNSNYSFIYFEYGANKYNVKITADGWKAGICGDITGQYGIPDGKVDMRDIAKACANFLKTWDITLP